MDTFDINFFLSSNGGLDSPLQPICNACLVSHQSRKSKTSHVVKKFKNMLELIIITYEAVVNFFSGFNDQAWYSDESMNKFFKLHTNNYIAQNPVWNQ